MKLVSEVPHPHEVERVLRMIIHQILQKEMTPEVAKKFLKKSRSNSNVVVSWALALVPEKLAYNLLKNKVAPLASSGIAKWLTKKVLKLFQDSAHRDPTAHGVA